MALEIGIRQEQGRRPYQEDEFLDSTVSTDVFNQQHQHHEINHIQTRNNQTHLYGIFDGHAGGKCSKFIASVMRETLQNSKSYKTNLKNAFCEAYKSANLRFLQIADKSGLNDGSTGLCVALRGSKCTVANVGDCRALIISSKKVEALSIDQKPNSSTEYSRILSLGGTVVNCLGVPRVNGILAVSRAFGNRLISDVIRPDPECIERELSSDDHYIVIASDGVWDVLRNSDVFRLCWQSTTEFHRSCQSIADDIIRLALVMGSYDNVSCVVIGVHAYVNEILAEKNRVRAIASSLSCDSVLPLSKARDSESSTGQQASSTLVQYSSVPMLPIIASLSPQAQSRLVHIDTLQLSRTSPASRRIRPIDLSSMQGLTLKHRVNTGLQHSTIAVRARTAGALSRRSNAFRLS